MDALTSPHGQPADTTWVPQFRGDHEAWTDLILRTDEFSDRFGRYRTGADMLLGEIMRYGALSDAAMIEPLRHLYSWFVGGGMPVVLRHEVYRHATELQQHAGFPVNTFLPFIACEPVHGICAAAVIDYVSIAHLTEGDPMSRVRDITGMIAAGNIVNRGAAFGGLLYLGDPRVCALLLPLRDGLTKSEASEAAQSHTGLVHASTTEFLIDWLEGMEGDSRDSTFAFVAAALSVTRRTMKWPFVMTGERPFPVYSVTPEQQREMAQFVPIEEFTKRVAPRLRDLERTEPAPKVMPDVLSAWGIAASQLGPF